MRGHIRRRGKTSFEYIVDIGTAPPSVARAATGASGSSASPESRVRSAAASFVRPRSVARDQGRLCHAARVPGRPDKVLTAVEARTFVAPTRITVKAFLLAEWLPAIKGTLRPTTFANYTMLAEAAHHPAPRRSLQLQNLNAAAINALYAYLSEEGRVRSEGGLSASSVRRVHAVPAPRLSRRRALGRLTVNPVDAADPPRASAEHSEQATCLEQRATGGLSRLPSPTTVSSPCWRLLAMTGMRRERRWVLPGTTSTWRRAR